MATLIITILGSFGGGGYAIYDKSSSSFESFRETVNRFNSEISKEVTVLSTNVVDIREDIKGMRQSVDSLANNHAREVQILRDKMTKMAIELATIKASIDK